MLTVKLRNEKTKRTRSIECLEVIVNPGDGVAFIYVVKANLPNENVEVRRLNGSADLDEFHVAFVENANGATIQVVKPI
jgi:hypothetical protein